MSHSAYQKIGEPLETNHFGCVFKGFEFEGQRDVRIVEFHERFASDRNRWDRIWQDVMAMANCRHPNLVPVVSISQSERHVVTEWPPINLETISQKKSLTPGEVRMVLLQALEGINAIHQHGMIHGDVRTSNLLLSEDRRLQLAFSPGLTFGGEYHQREIGNRYTSPESLNPAFGEIGVGVDLYALGFCALRLLLGPKYDKKFRAFKSEKEMENSWLQWHASPDEQVDIQKLLPELPSDLRDVLHRLTRKRVAERLESAAAASEMIKDSETKPLKAGKVAAKKPAKIATPAKQSAREKIVAQATAGSSEKKAKKGNSVLLKAVIVAATAVVLLVIFAPWSGMGSVSTSAPESANVQPTPNGDEAPLAGVGETTTVDPTEELAQEETTADVDQPVKADSFELAASRPTDPVVVSASGTEAPPHNNSDGIGQSETESSPTLTSPATGMKLVLLPAGEFMMGSPGSVPKVDDDQQPAHRVRISRPFYLGKYEVTRGQFRRFVEAQSYLTESERNGKGGQGYNLAEKKLEAANLKYSWQNAGFTQSDDHPVVNVTWNDAVAFCRWLSREDGAVYRLPTEAEWEYACRAGTTSQYFHGDDHEGLVEIGNVGDADAKAQFPQYAWMVEMDANDGYAFTAPVGQYRKNDFGLNDMHGNVSEWCQDWYDKDYYSKSPPSDPQGPVSGSEHISRGGSYVSFFSHIARSAHRSHTFFNPATCAINIGFRVVRVPNTDGKKLADEERPTDSDSGSKTDQPADGLEVALQQIKEGIRLFDAGERDKATRVLLLAISAAQRANAPSETLAEAWMYLGHAYSDQGNLDHSLKAYSKALRLNSRLTQAYTGRSLANIRSGKFLEARADAELAADANPEYSPAFNLLGVAFYNLQQPEEAAIAFDKAVDTDGKNTEALFNRARLNSHRAVAEQDKRESLRLNKKVIRDFTRVIRLHDKFVAESFHGRGVARFNIGERRQSIEDYNQAIKLKSDFADAYRNRALAYRQLGDPESAARDEQSAESLEASARPRP